MVKSDTQLCYEMTSQFPILGATLAEHIAYYDELLPHVFMADVTRYVLGHPDDSYGIVRYLNDNLSNGIAVELITASFLENIDSMTDLERIASENDVPTIFREWRKQVD